VSDTATPTAPERTILRCKAGADVHSLAARVSRHVEEGTPVGVTAIGAGAVNQAVKALTVAIGTLASRGIFIAFTTAWGRTTDLQTPSSSGGDELSLMQFNVEVLRR
jgi:stage V sporulation protein SpoVS